MQKKFIEFYPRLIEIIWCLVWVGLPSTSFPILGWVTNSQAAPFSAIPIAILIVIWFLPYLIQGRQLALETIPILGFTLVAILSSVLIYFTDIVPFENRSFLGQSLRAFFTLAIGLCFYILISTWFRSERSLNLALRWIHIGGAIMLLWGLMQIVIIKFMGGHFPPILDHIRVWLVIQVHNVREGTRVTGLAYEPSWFAHQLNLLYLPLWIASTYLRKSAFRFKFFGITFENLLLVAGLIEFVLSQSRVGFAALLAAIVFLLVKININIVKRLVNYLSSKLHLSDHKNNWSEVFLSILVSVILIITYSALLFVIVYVVTKNDARLALLFKAIPKEDLYIIKTFDSNTLLYFGQRLRFLERTLYWVTGWNVFRDFPIMGVGLGNVGFLAVDHAPQVAWATTEWLDLIYRFDFLINTKSYWVRILAETGLVGFSLFVTWLVGIWRSAIFLWSNPNKHFRILGLAGQLALAAFLFEGFSLDSFALPYLWVITGIVTAGRATLTNPDPGR